MGMDVYGRNPTDKSGEYFRANVWSWRPIHVLIIELCSDLFDEETLEGMGYNGGAGPEDQAICTEMANRFENWMEHNVNGLAVDLGMRMTPEGRLVWDEELEQSPDLETVTTHELRPGIEPERIRPERPVACDLAGIGVCAFQWLRWIA